MASPDNGLSARRRTRIACRRCNSKKVRCNAQKDRPCSSCASRDLECVLIDSQRGKYARRRTGSNHVNDQQSPITASHTRYHNEAFPDPNGDVHTAGSLEDLGAGQETPTQDSPAMLYAQVAEHGIDHVQRPITRSAKTYFLGEAFSLTYVINEILAPFLRGPNLQYQRRLHYPISEASSFTKTQTENPSLAQAILLQERGIYRALPQEHTAEFLKFYFKWFHPAFPIIDKDQFTGQVENGESSLLILNAALMIAVTICPEADLVAAGLPDRYAAREIFYRQAKLLYDEDADVDKINIVVGTFLLSFWWGGPDESKDSWHWLGISVSQAQSLGMHRSTLRSGMDREISKKWRRIWWSVRIREALVSGSIGRPQRFTEKDSDVEMLEPEDIVGGDVQKHYICQMARLCRILTNVIRSRYSVFQSSDYTDRASLEDALGVFQKNIPPVLQYHNSEPGSEQRLWSAMLTMALNYTAILVCRPARSIYGEEQTETWGNRTRAFRAANDVSRVMEDLLTDSMGQVCQIHTIPALFNALAIHLLTICTSSSVERELAENRVRVCMFGLESLQQSWPVGSWVLLMFRTVIRMLQKKYRKGQQSTTSRGRSNQISNLHLGTRSPRNNLSRRGVNVDLHPVDNTNPINNSAERSSVEGYGGTNTGGLDLFQNSLAHGTNMEEIPVDDWTFLQSLFDINPQQANPPDPDGFFELLNIPALGPST